MANRKIGVARRASELKRVSKQFKELVRVLVVCEGAKTEPNYIRELCRQFRIRATSVEIAGDACDSAPLSVYQFAAQRYRQDSDFDEIYCVFDRDRHATFDEALNAVRSHPSEKFAVIASYPCFEYWVLLHFRFTRAPYVAAGNSSPGDLVVKQVKQEWKEYSKGGTGVAAKLCSDGKLDLAIQRAAQARSDALATGELNPSTDIDKLVKRLRELATSQLKSD